MANLGPTTAHGTTPPPAEDVLRFDRPGLWVAIGLGLLAIAAHAGTLATMAERWASDPQYSHGFIVPVFAMVVLWTRRRMLADATWQPVWAGAGLLGIGLVLRSIAAQADIEPLDAFSLLPTLFGVVLLVGGWAVLAWAWPALAFLAFMMPLPFTLEMALSQPLRRIATEASTFALQTLGTPALAEGNIIYVDDVPLGVEQACSGLGMLVTFFALATAMALIVSAPIWQRLALVACAAPIAVVANVARITATGFAYHLGGRDSELAALIYHDLAGWLMMPLALVLLWLARVFFARLVIEVQDEAPPSVLGLARTTAAKSFGTARHETGASL